MRHLLIALLALALAGCWVGDGLFTDSDARPALAPGLYRISTNGEKPGEVRISNLRNGLTQMADKDGSSSDPDVYGFAPLDAQRGTFVAWQSTEKGSGSTRGEQLYLLGQRRADGSFVIYVPFCDDMEAEIARRAGATVEARGSGVKSDTCRFGTRASLENALRQLRPSDGKRMMTLELEQADRPKFMRTRG